MVKIAEKFFSMMKFNENEEMEDEIGRASCRERV